MKTRTLAGIAVSAVASVFLFATFVWPTSYVIVPQQSMVMRVNRFTGVEEWSSPRGWVREGETGPASVARNVTGSLLVKEMNIDPSNGLGELVLENSAGEPYTGIHLELSLLDAQGVVVGTTTQDIDKIEKGDKVRVTVMGNVTSGSPTLIRVDRAYSDWTPGTTVAAL